MITFIGLLAAALTTFAFLPQAIKALKTKHTKDISLIMVIMQTMGISIWIIYGLLITDIPIFLANTLGLMIVAVILAVKLKYG